LILELCHYQSEAKTVVSASLSSSVYEKKISLVLQKIVLEFLSKNWIMKYYESELFLYYMKMVYQQNEGKETSSIDLKSFLSYCSKNIVSVPSHMRFHHSNPLLLLFADSSSDCSTYNEEDTIIGIFELTRSSSSLSSSSAAVPTIGLSSGKKRLFEQRQHRVLSSSSFPDQKSSSEYVLKKSFLAPLKEVTSHNEDLTEIRKISSIYLTPELKEFYSSCMEATAAGHDDEKEIICKWRNFLLEGKPTELTIKSTSNNISSNSQSSFSSEMKLNQFYCSQLLIFHNDKNHPVEVNTQENDMNNEETSSPSSESIEFIQSKETISINSISKTLVAAAPPKEEGVVVPLTTHSDPPVEENIASKGFSSLHRRSLTFSASLQQTARELLGGGKKANNNGSSNNNTSNNWILLPTGSRDENDLLPVPSSQITEKAALSSFTTPEVEIPLTHGKIQIIIFLFDDDSHSTNSKIIISFLFYY
jgi:hypothetical protein